MIFVGGEEEDTAPQHFYVHPDGWEAFDIFETLRNQWRVLPAMTGVVFQGLDYSAVSATLATYIKKRKKRILIFDQLRLLEAGALSVLNEQNVSDNAADSR